METTDGLLDQPPLRRPAALETILLGGLTVAVLDITNAITFWSAYKGIPATRIFQSVASGLLGKSAFDGGMKTALLGAGLHTFIAFSVAAVFYAGCRVLPTLLRWPTTTGMLYGLAVFGVMNFIVIPHSGAAGGKHTPLWLRDDLFGHAVLIGLPVALIARWSANRHSFPARPESIPFTKPVPGTIP